MTCAEVQANLSLYLYGELDFAAEETIEIHLAECAFCELWLNREKEWHAVVNRHQRDVRPEWLSACRESLSQNIARQPATAEHLRHRIADWARHFFDFRFTDRSYRWAAVSSLLMLGFAAGRIAGHLQPTWNSSRFGEAGLFQPSLTLVKAIRPEAGNRVSIVLQSVQRREVSGSLNDGAVRAILLGAAQDSQDPGVRMDSVEMLAGQNGEDIRNALVNAIRNDPNAAVRAKAVESLRRLPGDSITREALEHALAHDSDASVRAEAINVLVPDGASVPLPPRLVQTLSNVLNSPSGDDYVRWRCARVLDAQTSIDSVY